MPIIQATDNSKMEQINKLVSIANDTLNLPYATIGQDVFLGDANLYIQAHIPDWEFKTGDDLTRLGIITMKKTAVNILAAFGRTTSESVDDVSESREQLTPSQAIVRYEDDIEKGIEILNPHTTTDSRYITSAVVV